MIERGIEETLFRSRWLLAPLYLGLVGALVILLVKFIKKFVLIVPNVLTLESSELIVQILGLVDIVLIANLLLMIIFSGYENFVSKIDMIKNHVDRPDWMGKVDYGGLKLKVIGSIVAISSIELLRTFIGIQQYLDAAAAVTVEPSHLVAPSTVYIGWLMGLHITFVVSGLLFAITEKISEHHDHAKDKEEVVHDHVSG